MLFKNLFLRKVKKFSSLQTEASSTYTQVESWTPLFPHMDSKKSVAVVTSTNPEEVSQSRERELENRAPFCKFSSLTTNFDCLLYTHLHASLTEPLQSFLWLTSPFTL